MIKRLISFKKRGLMMATSTLALAGILGLSSCLDDIENPNLPPTAYVSVYQGSPDAPELDIYADANRINNQALDFAEALAYSPFYVGERQFKVTAFDAASSLLEKDFVLGADTVYSLFILNKMPDLDAILVEDDWEDPTAEEAQVRLVHLSPDTEEVYVKISDSEDRLSTDVDFGGHSGFSAIATDTYDIEVIAVDTEEVIVSASDVELKGNRVYTFILRGLAETEDEDLKLDLQLLTNYVNYQ
ncbi:DUF4397 domain-containing protein [Algoriphagus hitonicola]|uniref:DUF4397 domain-containing protein n=1 Tax=Algoriphagus hitonicola TaxID=435880 RepID=A0A1I2VVY2_9BACT|nr:DUF4397 domain-containing protein [Algoriphagus hitonicola]SFG91846.1 protein of unknown function [Algoriphagus hitonicola]